MGFDSLVIANTVELLNGGVFSANPLCFGAKFQLQPGADPGAPQPTTDFVASLLLDGERPFGRRASNRTVKLPVWITAPNRQILAAAREVLQQAIDQDYFTIVWTRDPAAGNPGSTALPLVLDCFRAQATTISFNTRLEKQLIGMQVALTIPALPYGRSDTQAQISFTSPAPTSPVIPPPPAPVLLDNFSQISSTLFSQSSQCVVGPNTGCWDPDAFGDPGGQATPLTYSSSFSSPLNLSQMTALQFWFGLGSRYYSYLEFHGKTHGNTVSVTLTDTSGNTLSFSRGNLFLPVSNSAQAPVFTRVTVPIPQGSAVFRYNAVASYSLTVTNRQDRIRRLSNVTAYLDNLVALPGSQQVTPVVRGAVYTLYGIAGTARAPVSMTFQQTPSAGTVTTVTAAGPGTYIVPGATAYLTVNGIGGGGAGAGMTAAGVGPGGGGGEDAGEQVFAASASQVIPYVVGAGAAAGASPASGQATVFGPTPGGTLQLTANGGASVATNGTVAGAGGSGSVNAVEHPGGAGRANPAGTFGGGGGSSAGPLAAGNTPVGSGSVSFSGSTTWTCPAGVFTVNATVTGAGGGAGSGGANLSGFGGGGGEVRIGAVAVTPGNVYTVTCGAGGAAGSPGAAGSTGGQSSFTGDSNSVVAHAGHGGPGNSGGALAAGGSGGTGTTGYNGGTGGSGYPYAGGGGSSAGSSAAGNNGSSPGGAIAPTGGGNGGNSSGAQNGNGQNGSFPGGGGGGTWNGSFTSGAGAGGQVTLTYPANTGAPTSSGGAAVTGGGAGGNGGGSPGSAGSAGAAPGGGGGGGDSSGSTVAGGAGAAGQLTITPYAPSAFKSLIVHRPPLGALKTFQPLVSVGGGSDAPDGTHQYTMPQPVTGVNADFGGTYSVYLVNSSWNGGSGSGTTRNIFVTVTQFEYAGGPGYSQSTLTITIAPNQVTNGIVQAGVLTLPVKAVAPDNLGGYYTASVTDSNTSDRFYDLIFLDTMGQTVVVNEPTQGYLNYYIDAPDPNVSLGRVMGSNGGRPNAISVMDNSPAMSGGTLYVEPADGDNQLFVYCADASAPNVSLSYFPCYYFDRTQ